MKKALHFNRTPKILYNKTITPLKHTKPVKIEPSRTTKMIHSPQIKHNKELPITTLYKMH